MEKSKALFGLALLLTVGCLVGVVAAQEESPLEAGTTRLDEHGIAQVWVPAGCFMMGSSQAEATYAMSLQPPAWARAELPTERPQHEVCLTQGYWIDQYEVTNEAYQAFIDDGGYTTEQYWSEAGWAWLGGRSVDNLPANCITAEPDHPRVCITWYEAEAYATWRGGSLPTEAQWEYAARGPESFVFPWGNEWDSSLATIEPLPNVRLLPVGSFEGGESWVGAYDMAGNAMEWVSNWFDPNYYDLEVRDDPTGPETGTRKPEKGGWWGSHPFVARSAFHLYEDPPTYQDHHIGVRVITPGDAAG